MNNKTTTMTDSDDYPWRSSLTNVARCGMCQHQIIWQYCVKGLQLKYPLLNKEHDCPEYSYNPNPIVILEQLEIFTDTPYPECSTCAHNCEGICSGKKWVPHKTDTCEFYRSKDLTCAFAIPFIQYASKTRNNHCTKPPEQRHDYNNDWKCCCPQAHTQSAERCYTCYQKRTSEA